MAITMIGVYHTLSDARAAIETLTTTGIDPNAVKLVTNDEQSEHLVDLRGLIGGLVGISAAPKSLVELNIPEKATDIYLEGLRQGQSLVVVTVADNLPIPVKELLGRHQPAEIVQV